MLQFNATLVFVFISFVAFMLIMKAIYFDPMLVLMAEREQKTVGDMEQSNTFHAEAEKLLKEYDKKMLAAQKQAGEMIQSKRQEALKKSQGIITLAKNNAQHEMTRALFEIDNWQRETYQAIAPQQTVFSQIIIEKIKNKETIPVL